VPPTYEFIVAGERGTLAGTSGSLVLGLHGRLPEERHFGAGVRFTPSLLASLLRAGVARVWPLGSRQNVVPYRHPQAHTFAALARHFLDVVEGTATNQASWMHATRTLQVILGAYRAAAERRTVHLPEDPTQLDGEAQLDERSHAVSTRVVDL
jgi:predicted dehydrogenase